MSETRYVADGLSWSQSNVRDPSLAVTSETRPVRDRAHALGHRGHDLPRHFVIGEIVGRKPEMVVVVLALAPDLTGTVGLALRRDVGQATAVRDDAVIDDGEASRVAEAERTGEEHDEGVAVPRRAIREATPDAIHDELGAGIEDQGVEPRPPGDDRRGDASIERRRIPVEVGHLDALMNQVEVVRARVVIISHAFGVGLGGQRSDGKADSDEGERRTHRFSLRAEEFGGGAGIYAPVLIKLVLRWCRNGGCATSGQS